MTCEENRKCFYSPSDAQYPFLIDVEGHPEMMSFIHTKKVREKRNITHLEDGKK
jgi:hypothetical protein